MCLEYIDNLKTEVSKLKAKGGYITLWKVFEVIKNEELVSSFYNFVFYEGKNTAGSGRIAPYWFNVDYKAGYKAGFHCFVTKRGAIKWKNNKECVQPVKVRRKWITAMGRQNGNRVAICKHIII